MDVAMEPAAKAALEKSTGPLAQQIEKLVLRKIADDSLALPALPSAIARCMELLKDASAEPKEYVVVLETDPMLAARVFRMANSAAFGGTQRSATLMAAVTRLGLKRLKTLLLQAASERLFISKNASIAALAASVWQHSVAVALIARDLCALTARSDSEEACIAGLLHDVGKPIVASVLLEAERQIVELRGSAWIGSEEWTYVLARTHRAVGVAVAQKWELPEVVRTTVRDCSEFDAANRASLANVLCFANALAKTAGICPPLTDIEDAKALVLIGRSLLGVEEQVVGSLSSTIKGRVAEVA